jgi:hypothetical protein
LGARLSGAPFRFAGPVPARAEHPPDGPAELLERNHIDRVSRLGDPGKSSLRRFVTDVQAPPVRRAKPGQSAFDLDFVAPDFDFVAAGLDSIVLAQARRTSAIL